MKRQRHGRPTKASSETAPSKGIEQWPTMSKDERVQFLLTLSQDERAMLLQTQISGLFEANERMVATMEKMWDKVVEILKEHGIAEVNREKSKRQHSNKA